MSVSFSIWAACEGGGEVEADMRNEAAGDDAGQVLEAFEKKVLVQASSERSSQGGGEQTGMRLRSRNGSKGRADG